MPWLFHPRAFFSGARFYGDLALIKYVVRRLLVLPVVMLVVTAVLFSLIIQLPVEVRAQVYLPAGNPHKTEEQYLAVVEEVIERNGLDQPFWVQYTHWLGNLIQGEWGVSPSSGQSVLEGLKQRAPATIELALFATIPSVALALSMGSWAARFYRRLPDYLVRTAAFVAWAFPPFIMALLLMNVLYAWTGWFPPERASQWAKDLMYAGSYRPYTGLYSVDALINGDMKLFIDALRHLVLPALTLAVVQWALLARIMRASLLDALRQDYIVTARSKGLREHKVVSRHARRNAILPVISAASVSTSMFFTTAVVVEVVFSINGVGSWAAAAIRFSDVPVAVGFTLFACMVTVFASLAADLLYAVVDPRVRLG